ncbi:MAG: hypothetical protein K2X98_00655 [Alphaproteobacteria bacterium]|nr:hypothetical protein [Alphaproteobacteria bacterium]
MRALHKFFLFSTIALAPIHSYGAERQPQGQEDESIHTTLKGMKSSFAIIMQQTSIMSTKLHDLEKKMGDLDVRMSALEKAQSLSTVPSPVSESSVMPITPSLLTNTPTPSLIENCPKHYTDKVSREGKNAAVKGNLQEFYPEGYPALTLGDFTSNIDVDAIDPSYITKKKPNRNQAGGHCEYILTLPQGRFLFDSSIFIRESKGTPQDSEGFKQWVNNRLKDFAQKQPQPLIKSEIKKTHVMYIYEDDDIAFNFLLLPPAGAKVN